MGLRKALVNFRGGYPGGWKQYARGYQGDATPEFVQPTSPDDRRSVIPSVGLREYWYPALPDKGVGRKKPVGLKLLGEDLVFFRDVRGEVQALWDYCPHRGVYLSFGNCFFEGYLSCAYHGATYDGDGECVEFITEGPDSKMVGQLKAKKFPTITKKGIVFVWMGEGIPVPPEEDIPPEFFEGKETQVWTTFRYWNCNWMIALENTSDSHNAFWVHRNALRVMFSSRGDLGGRPRTPVGYRSELVNEKIAMVVNNAETANYYADENGKIPYKLYYPRVGAYWPKSSWRLSWVWAFKLLDRITGANRRPGLGQGGKDPRMPDDWQGGSMRLPGMQRLIPIYTRWCVPVEKDLTRTIYTRFRRHNTAIGRLLASVKHHVFINFLNHFNFSDQDYDAMRSTRWQHPEYLSATDSHLVAERRLIAEHGRGVQRQVDVAEVTSAEQQVVDGNDALGVGWEDYGQIHAAGNGQDAEKAETARPPAGD